MKPVRPDAASDDAGTAVMTAVAAAAMAAAGGPRAAHACRAGRTRPGGAGR